MNILNAQQLSKAYGPRVLFSDIALAVDVGEKVGMIGPNGCGKSTLFKILAGAEDADTGEVSFKRDANVSYLAQNPDFAPGTTPQSVVAEVLRPLRDAIAAFDVVSMEVGQVSGERQASLLAEQATLMARIERLGGWNWEHRVENVLEQLGIRDELRERSMDQLSGGQRRRTALAQILLTEPDLMILDEPTNHLDADTIDWLEERLMAFQGAVLLVTHDRYFLERVVDRIVELTPAEIHSYPGQYAVYLERKLERMRVENKTLERQKKLFEQELEWLSRSPSARRTKAQSRVKRVEELADATRVQKDLSLNLDLQMQRRHTNMILEVMGLYKSYDDVEILNGVGFVVGRTDKLGIVGPNGCGKSTLLKILMGVEKHDAGKYTWGKNVRVAYLSQTRDELARDQTVYESLGPADTVKIGTRSVHKRTYLREFLFRDEEQRKKVGSLSGGERCRLLLARVMMENANFLILDEPTNDLDIDTLQLLEDALVAFQGCVLLVTHDRYLLNRVATAILAFEEGDVVRYEGDYDFYRERRDARLRAHKRAETEARKAAVQAERAVAQKAKAEQPRKLSYKERQELEGIESEILEAEEAKETLETKLADPALYQKTPERVPELTEALREAGARVDTLYARWEELEAIASEPLQ